MGVFNFHQVHSFKSPDSSTSDEMASAFIVNVARCGFCNEEIRLGQRVMHWRVSEGGDDLVFHAECVKKNARGLIKDIAECMR